MRSATFALVLAFCMLGMLALGSSFGFDASGIFSRFVPERQAAVQGGQASTTQAEVRNVMETPAGFRGPTGQPYVRGPVGPPPEE